MKSKRKKRCRKKSTVIIICFFFQPSRHGLGHSTSRPRRASQHDAHINLEITPRLCPKLVPLEDVHARDLVHLLAQQAKELPATPRRPPLALRGVVLEAQGPAVRACLRVWVYVCVCMCECVQMD